MSRQLIICCDGTNNNLTGGAKDTNVTKLCDLLAPDAHDQLLYYDPGVGNPGELPGASLTDNLSRTYERLHGLAFGKGVYENIAEAYLFLMRRYRPGDQIFLFGFSRGAFTARSIGGLVTQFGLLRPEMEGLVPTLLHTYFSDRERGGQKYTAIREQISRLFTSDQTRATPVWFVGVWDTVSSVGAPLLSRTITASPTIVGKRFNHVRQALAPSAPPGPPRVHSETWPTALWALAGLQQRNPYVVLDAGEPQEVVPVEHPSVAAFGLSFPADTVWARRRPVAGLLMAFAFAAVFWLLAGGLLQGLIVPARMTLWECLLALGQSFNHAGQIAAANLALARWQLEWAPSMVYPLATLPQPPGRVAGAI